MSANAPDSPSVCIIVPVLDGGENFALCLQSLAALSPRPAEILIVDDGSSDDSRGQAQGAGFKVLRTPHLHGGPAAARNLAAARTQADLLFFVDADVRVPADAVARVVESFRAEPALAALYGSYDDRPSAPDFLSQYKNLFHHFIHQDATGAATSFWSGCGAIRREVFTRLGGFSDAYRRPSIEDIELGYRLKKEGYQTRIIKRLQVTHLKRWTLAALVNSDVRYRAAPWAQLILRDHEFPADLNLKLSHRLSVMAAYALLDAAVFSAAPLALGCIIGLYLLNWRLYRFFAARRGVRFALAAVPLHWFYYLYSGLGFMLGLAWWLLPLTPSPNRKRRGLGEGVRG
ncbi:MAG: glycosyltransferase [Chloroflexi bacterium]|nr:glycosyltransferase [Chloroflexota bacterium]